MIFSSFLLALTAYFIMLSPASLSQGIDKNQDDWLLFRGDSAQTGFLKKSIALPLEVKWKFSCKDAIEGTASCAKGKVIFGCMDEKVYCLDENTGKEIWSTKAGPIKATPSILNNFIYIGDMDGGFHSLNLENGKSAWTFKTNGEISGGANFHESQILIGSQDEHLYCLDQNGKEVWKFKMDGPFFGSCAIKEGKTFAAGCDSTLHVIDAKTGKELSSLDLGGQTGATAAVSGHELFVGTMSNNVLGIDWKSAKITWNYQPEKRAQPFFSSCAITDYLIIVGGRDRKLHAINRKDGKERWSILTDGKIDSSPLVMNETVIFGSFDGNLYLASLSDGKILQKINLGGEIAGSPIFCRDGIFIGTLKGDLYKLVPKQP